MASRSAQEGAARKQQATANAATKAAQAAAQAAAKKQAASGAAAATQAGGKRRSAQEGAARKSNVAAAGSTGTTTTTPTNTPSATPLGTGDLSGLGIGNSSNLGDLFPGATPDQVNTLLGSGGYGEALRYKLGLIEADLLKLKNEADAANQRAQIALDQGKLVLAQKEEADANAIKVQINVLQEQQQRFTAQGNYADALMKLGEAPENAYKYAFARYGLTPPQGGQSMSLPEPDAVKGMLLNPNATGQPPATSVVTPPPAPPKANLQGLLPSQPGANQPTATPATPLPSTPNPAPPAPIAAALGSAITPPPTAPPAAPAPAARPPEQAAPLTQPPPTGFAGGGIAGAGDGSSQANFAPGGIAGAAGAAPAIHPIAEALMKHALDMAKQGGALAKHHLAPAASGPSPQGGGLGAMMPPMAPPAYGSGAMGLPNAPSAPTMSAAPRFASGGVAGDPSLTGYGPGTMVGLMPGELPYTGPTGPSTTGSGPAEWVGLMPGEIGPMPTPPAPTPTPSPSPVPPPPGPTPTPAPPPGPPLFGGGSSPYGMPNENQNLGGYSGPVLTLPPALQRLFAQTGHQESGVPINAPAGWQIPHLGTPSAQSLRFLSPDELANTQGFERDIEGKPIETFKSDIAQHADQGAGLEIPHSFARGGIAGLPAGMPAVAPFAQAGLPPNDQTAGVYPGFALGGVAGVPTGTGRGVPLPPPPPQPGTAQVPGVGQVAPGPATFGEAGPEAAVPLNSPGGPLAMQALAANQGGPPASPDLGALLGPTSTDVGPQPSQAILPLTNIPTQALGPGVRSEAVGRLQQALEQAGYLQMPPSANYGFYGPVTVHAVRRFQQDNGITAGTPGIWNKPSAVALKSFLSGPASTPPGPSPYDMRGAGAPGDLTGPQPGPAAAAGASLPAGGGPGGLSRMMPLGL
jgi:hypothetical protein